MMMIDCELPINNDLDLKKCLFVCHNFFTSTDHDHPHDDDDDDGEHQ